MLRTEDLWPQISSFLEQAGFPASGAVDYGKARGAYAIHAERYLKWVESGNHGEMRYLERGLARRLDPSLVFPDLKGVIAVLKPYSPHPVGDENLRYARYLNGPDYHESMKSALEGAFSSLSATGKLPADFQYKICVDTSAVLERAWALLCGLGWIGKNTMLIHPQLGSYVFIGIVFTNVEFGRGPELMKDYCGNCSRCIQACPTEALGVRQLDSRKCISYLTIEKRGTWEADFNTSGFVAGCDLCQEACPYNTKPAKYIPKGDLAAHLVTDPHLLETEDQVTYETRIHGTALERIRFTDFKRNFQATRRGSRK